MRKKRFLALAAAVLTVITVLAGCSGKNSGDVKQTPEETKPAVGCNEIIDRILEQVDDTHNDARTSYGEELYSDYFETLYNADIDDISDGAFAYASASYADEITVVRMKSDEDTEEFREKLESRIERRKQDFNGYKPEEVKKLESAQTAVSGNYVIMAVGERAQDIVDEFKDILREE